MQGRYRRRDSVCTPDIHTMRLTKLLLMTLSAIRRDRAAAVGVIMKEAGSTAGKHHAATS